MNRLRPRSLFCLFALLLAPGGTAWAQAQPHVVGTGEIGGGFGPATGARVAALNSARVAIAWTVGEGDGEGVYLLQRNDFLWDAAPAPLPGDVGIAPRDASLMYDYQGYIHVVWTALSEGRRLVYHAVMNGAEPIKPARAINAGDHADADYPLIVNLGGRLPLAVWQANHMTHFTIEAQPLSYAAEPMARISPVSGVSQSAMCPVLVQQNPLVIGYYEILQSSRELRVVTYSFISRRWEPINLPGFDPQLAMRENSFVQGTSDGAPYACWTDRTPGEAPSIQIGRRASVESETVIVESLNHPLGDPTHPQLVAQGDWLTVTWQTFAGGVQSIALAGLDWASGEKSSMPLATPDHRFPSDPWHASQGNWSFVVWTDNHRDGGTGQIGYAEFLWPQSE